jgi:protein O-mannosyl-transferase
MFLKSLFLWKIRAVRKPYVRIIVMKKKKSDKVEKISSGLEKTVQFVGKFFYVLATLAVFFVFFRVYQFKFVYWDDHVHLFMNSYLQPFTFSSLWHFWTHGFEGFYIPVTYTVWGVLEALFGLNPAVFHFTNVILHLANCFLVFNLFQLILTKTGQNSPPHKRAELMFSAAAGALLFTLHPIQVESVAWATGMKDVLCTFLSLLSIRNCLEKSTLKGFVFFVLALLAKPSAIVIPFVLLVIETLILKKDRREVFRRFAPWLPLLLPVCLVMMFLQPSSKLEFVPPVWFRPFIISDTYGFYFLKLLLPVSLTPVYGRTPEVLLQSKMFYYTWTIPAAVILSALLVRRKRSWILGSILFFIVSIAPVSGLIPFSHQLISTVCDRYLYFPLIGLCLGFSFWVYELITESFKLKQQIILAGAACLLTVFGLLSTVQVQKWENDDVLFPYMESVTPDVAIIYGNYGISLIQRNEVSGSLKQFYRATQLKDDPDYLNDLGIVLARVGKTEEAKLAYRKGLSIDPKHQAIIGNLKLIER